MRTQLHNLILDELQYNPGTWVKNQDLVTRVRLRALRQQQRFYSTVEIAEAAGQLVQTGAISRESRSISGTHYRYDAPTIRERKPLPPTADVALERLATLITTQAEEISRLREQAAVAPQVERMGEALLELLNDVGPLGTGYRRAIQDLTHQAFLRWPEDTK